MPHNQKIKWDSFSAALQIYPLFRALDAKGTLMEYKNTQRGTAVLIIMALALTFIIFLAPVNQDIVFFT